MIKSLWHFPYMRFLENRMGNLEFCDDYLFVCASNLFLLGSVDEGKKVLVNER